MGWRLAVNLKYWRITDRLSPEVAGRLDLFCQFFRAPWGGPLNGQARRREIVCDLAAAIPFDRAIETGTYRGATANFFAGTLGLRVDTVEHDPRLHAYCKSRLAARPNVHVAFADSRRFLTTLAGHPGTAGESTLFYLDAHWGPDFPLVDELGIVAAAWRRAIIMIDDFQVPGDDGYGYDPYGEGRSLTEAVLPGAALSGWSLFYPRASSAEETGARRGCAVLASPALVDMVHGITSLRLARAFA